MKNIKLYYVTLWELSSCPKKRVKIISIHVIKKSWNCNLGKTGCVQVNNPAIA